MRICIMIQLFFIFFPGAAGYDHRMTSNKIASITGIGSEAFGNIYHPVKTSVSTYEIRNV